MKITKRQLRSMIRTERASVIREDSDWINRDSDWSPNDQENFDRDSGIARRASERQGTETSESVDTAPAVEAMEEILNGLWDDGVDNDQLKELLTQMIKHIDTGYIGEPS